MSGIARHWLGLLVVCCGAALWAACGDDDPDDATPPPTATGAACPIEPDICDTAVGLFDLVREQDIAGLMQHAAPRTASCGSEPATQPTDACFGAEDGEERSYFGIAQGHGFRGTPEWFVDQLELHLESVPAEDPGGSDSYGPGRLTIASVQCFRTEATPECSREWAKVTYTAIGLDGSRHVYCLELRRATSGEWGISGAGCSVPPLHNLEAFQVEAIGPDGSPGMFSSHPWSPE